MQVAEIIANIEGRGIAPWTGEADAKDWIEAFERVLRPFEGETLREGWVDYLAGWSGKYAPKATDIAACCRSALDRKPDTPKSERPLPPWIKRDIEVRRHADWVLANTETGRRAQAEGWGTHFWSEVCAATEYRLKRGLDLPNSIHRERIDWARRHGRKHIPEGLSGADMAKAMGGDRA